MTRERQSGLALVERPAEVEASLWRRWRFEAEFRCREQLFNRHSRLARALAWREYRRRPSHGLDRADFDQLALSGLLEALDRYDPLVGTPFTAFARYRIRGAIADGLAHSSESAANFAFRRRVEIERLRSLEGNQTENTADALRAIAEVAVGLAIGLIAERAGAEETSDPYQSNAWRELEVRLHQEIDRLPSAQRSVMTQHYRNGLPFGEIARLLGLSNGRISQLHRAAIISLRRRLGGQE